MEGPKRAISARRSQSTIHGCPRVLPGGFNTGIALILLISLSSVGCTHMGGTSAREWFENGFKVGHNYLKPASSINHYWVNSNQTESVDCEEAEATAIPNQPQFTSDYTECAEWWDDAFHDPILNDLIKTAYQQNLSLQEAAFRVLEARALRGVAIGGLFPQSQTASGSYTHRQLRNNMVSDNWNLGFGLAWEFDVWGKLRRRVELADANLDASIENYDAVLLTRIADVAATYVEIRTLQRRIEIACQNLKRQQRTANASHARIGTAVNPPTTNEIQKIVFAQAKTNALQTEASIPPLRASLAQAYNGLSILMGVPPRDLASELGSPPRENIRDDNNKIVGDRIRVPSPTAENFDVSVGIPADLLRRRPDVRAAERAVAAQSARVGVAIADLYPAFSLTGSLNWSAADLDDVFKSASFGGAVSPAFRWNLLNYGRLTNAIAANEASLGRLATAYQSAVLNAQLEVENAMAGYARQYQTVKLLEAAQLQARAAAVDVSHLRQNDPVTEANFTFVSQSALLANENALARARQSLAVNLITLHRALGGGWEIRSNTAYSESTGFDSSTGYAEPFLPEEIVPVLPETIE